MKTTSDKRKGYSYLRRWDPTVLRGNRCRLFLCFCALFSPRLEPSPPVSSQSGTGLADGTNCSCLDSQGVLVVMLIFTVLELLMATYASILWWKQLYSKNPGVSTLTCHMTPAGSQHWSCDVPGLNSGRKRRQWGSRSSQPSEWGESSMNGLLHDDTGIWDY